MTRSYGGPAEAARLRALLVIPEPAWEPPILPSPTYHYEETVNHDGTVIRWPVLDGYLPASIGERDDDEDYDRDR